MMSLKTVRKYIVNGLMSLVGVVLISYFFNTYHVEDLTGKKVIVIGSSSGIGEALAKKLSEMGCSVGLVARRLERLEKLGNELPGEFFIKKVDVSEPDSARELVRELIDEMGGLDIMVVNAGVGYENFEVDFSKIRNTIDVNVIGFTAITSLVMNHFFEQESGHLVGVSSIVGYRGFPNTATYSASKAFMSNYMQGMRHNIALRGLSKSVFVTDIKPGWVETELTESRKNKFWVVSSETAAEQIYYDIAKRKKEAIVTPRWKIFAMFFRYAPDWLFEKMLSSHRRDD